MKQDRYSPTHMGHDWCIVLVCIILVVGNGRGVGAATSNGPQDDGSDSLALALMKAYAVSLEAGELVAHERELLNEGSYFAQTFVLTGYSSPSGWQAGAIPTPSRTGILDAILTRGALRVASVCGADHLGYDNSNGAYPPRGPRGDQWATVVSRLGALYNVTQLKAVFVCVKTDFDAILALEESRVDVVDSQTWTGGETSSIRWSSKVRPGVTFTATIDSYEVLASSGITSVADIVNQLTPTTVIATVGSSARQVLQAVFPQLPPENLIDAGTTAQLASKLRSNAALATFDVPVNITGQQTVQLLGSTLTPHSWFTRYGTGRPNPDSPAGLEAFALALEAGWANLAFTGIRELVLGLYANVQMLLDAAPSPTVLYFPDQVGLLNRVVQNLTVTIGELRAGPALVDPWFTVTVDNSSGTPVEVPAGATVTLLQSIFNVIGIVYAVPPGESIQLVWRFYDTPEQLFSALQSGEIDMTAGMTGIGTVVNQTTVDYLAFRRLVALYGEPLALYFEPGLFSQTEQGDTVAVLRAINDNNVIGGRNVFTVAVPSQLHAEILKSYVPGFRNASQVLFSVVPSISDLVQAVAQGTVMFGFVEQNTDAVVQNLPSVVLGFRPIVPFVKADAPVTTAALTLQYVKWSSGAAIAVTILVVLAALVLVGAAAFLTVKRDSVIVQQSNLVLNLLLLLGLLLAVCMPLTYAGRLTSAECAIRPWLGGLGLAFVLGVLVAKLYYLNSVLNNTSLSDRKLPMSQLLLPVAIVLAVEVILLIVWTAVARLEPKARPGVDDQRLVLICTNHRALWVFLGLQIAYAVLLIGAAVYFSVLTRKVHTQVIFAEPKWISYAIYMLALCLLVFALLSGFLWNSHLSYFLGVTLVIIVTVAGTFALLFGHKSRFLLMSNEAVTSHSTSANTPSFTTQAHSVNSESY